MLRAGFARVQITPPVGTVMAGHPGLKRCAGVLDELFARVMMLESGASRIALVAVDTLFISDECCSRIRDRAAGPAGIPPDGILVFATHTHSGPMTTALFGHSTEAAYVKRLEELISSGITAASAHARPAHLHADRALVPGLSANARYIMKHGRVETHPWKGDPAIVRPEGPVDDELLAFVVTSHQGAVLGGLVNYANHPQVLSRENTLISADFPGRMERCVRDRLGAEAIVLFGNGASGNLCPVDALNTDRTEVGEAWMDHIGSELAERFVALTRRAPGAGDLIIRQATSRLPLPIRDLPANGLRRAHDFRASAEPTSESGVAVSDWGTEGRSSGRMSLEDYLQTEEWKRQEYTDLLELEARRAESPSVVASMVAVRVGEVGISLAPFELFTELGLEIKSRSPFNLTMVIELANGALGYVPTQEAFSRTGGYETLTLTSSQLRPSASSRVVDESIRLLNECAAEAVDEPVTPPPR